jgi:hypothetical protein
VNDTSGHIAGDELLEQLAIKLRMELREADTLPGSGATSSASCWKAARLKMQRSWPSPCGPSSRPSVSSGTTISSGSASAPALCRPTRIAAHCPTS